MTSKRVIAISLAVVGVAVAGLWLATHDHGALLSSPRALAVSQPRTVATLPVGPAYWWMSWIDDHTLAFTYQFVSVGALSGIVTVDIGTGRAGSIVPPTPLGGSPRTLRRWGNHTSSGQPASVELPPIETGRRGALSYDRVRASPADGLIAYEARAVAPNGTTIASSPLAGLWIARPDGSQARRVASWAHGPDEFAWSHGPDEFAWSPDGRWLFFWAQHRDGTRGLWVCRKDGTGVRLFAGGMIYEAQVSPDAQRVAFTRGGSSGPVMSVAPVTAGGPTVAVKGASFPVWASGELLCLIERTARKRTLRDIIPWLRRPPPAPGPQPWIAAVDPANRSRTWVAPVDASGRWSQLAAVPWMTSPAVDTGAFLLIEPTEAGPQQCSICALARRGLQRAPLPGDVGSVAWSPDGQRLAYIEGSEIKVVEVSLKTVRRP